MILTKFTSVGPTHMNYFLPCSINDLASVHCCPIFDRPYSDVLVCTNYYASYVDRGHRIKKAACINVRSYGRHGCQRWTFMVDNARTEWHHCVEEARSAGECVGDGGGKTVSSSFILKNRLTPQENMLFYVYKNDSVNATIKGEYLKYAGLKCDKIYGCNEVHERNEGDADDTGHIYYDFPHMSFVSAPYGDVHPSGATLTMVHGGSVLYSYTDRHHIWCTRGVETEYFGAPICYIIKPQIRYFEGKRYIGSSSKIKWIALSEESSDTLLILLQNKIMKLMFPTIPDPITVNIVEGRHVFINNEKYLSLAIRKVSDVLSVSANGWRYWTTESIETMKMFFGMIVHNKKVKYGNITVTAEHGPSKQIGGLYIRRYRYRPGRVRRFVHDIEEDIDSDSDAEDDNEVADAVEQENF